MNTNSFIGLSKKYLGYGKIFSGRKGNAPVVNFDLTRVQSNRGITK